MSEEFIDKIIEDKKQEKRKFWIGVLISFLCLLIITGACISVYNSDWYINQTITFKNAINNELGKKSKWSYTNKYERGKLKIRLTISNIDNKIMDWANNYFSDSDYLITLHFLDKDGYKLKELELPIGNFAKTDDGVYVAQSEIEIDKDIMRKIKGVEPIYRLFLDMKYDEMLKEMQKEYRKTMNNVFGGLFGY